MSTKKQSFSEQLRQAIERSGKTRYRIAQETGIAQSVLSRFVNGETGLQLSSIDKLADCISFRLEVEEETTKTSKPSRKSKKGK